MIRSSSAAACEVTAAGAGATEDPVRLRPVAPADAGSIARWLQAASVVRWWGSAGSAAAEAAIARESPTALRRMIEIGGEAAGYGHAIEAEAFGAVPEHIQPGTWRLNLIIGSEPHRGKGHGRAALALLSDEVFRTTLAVSCLVLVSVRNETVVRACETIGFRWVGIHRDALIGPTWALQRDRPRA